jgi:hypothetical protein
MAISGATSSAGLESARSADRSSMSPRRVPPAAPRPTLASPDLRVLQESKEAKSG